MPSVTLVCLKLIISLREYNCGCTLNKLATPLAGIMVLYSIKSYQFLSTETSNVNELSLMQLTGVIMLD